MPALELKAPTHSNEADIGHFVEFTDKSWGWTNFVDEGEAVEVTISQFNSSLENKIFALHLTTSV